MYYNSCMISVRLQDRIGFCACRHTLRVVGCQNIAMIVSLVCFVIISDKLLSIYLQVVPHLLVSGVVKDLRFISDPTQDITITGGHS